MWLHVVESSMFLIPSDAGSVHQNPQLNKWLDYSRAVLN